MKKRIVLSLFAVSVTIVFFCAVAHTETPQMTAADVEAFVDGVMPLQLQQEDIAGAVVVVVKDGSVLFAKGYGYSDVKKKTPVSAETTLFRPGSVSKLFGWTAVMQLKEKGKLDLDRDINEYLDFKIPATQAKPITLRDLMTHRPGFEEAVKDLFVAKAPDMNPLKSYLEPHIPARIFPPGTTPAYSNYGSALTGYIIERVSGKPFAKYIEDEILKPLGMTHSTFTQPLPAALQPLMSKGYTVASGDPGEFELVNAAPAGALSSSGGDMANFMIAHLQDGHFQDFQLLQPETAREMHSPQKGWIEGLNAMCLGFYEENRNHHRIISHAGDTIYFHSDLHLILDAGVGFFVSYNSGGRRASNNRVILWENFLDRYFPAELPKDAAFKPNNEAAKLAGQYLVSRRGENGILRLLFMLLEMSVKPEGDGVITVSEFKDWNEHPKRWKQIRPLVYREVGGQELIGFVRDSAGKLTLQGAFPPFVYERVPWNKNKWFLITLLGFTVGVLLLTLLLWPVAALVRRHYAQSLALPAREKRYRMLARLVCAIQLGFLLVFTVVMIQGFNDITIFSSAFDPWFRILQVVALLGVIGALVAVVNAWISMGSMERGRWSKLGEVLIALACIGFVWIVIAGDFLSLSLKY